MNRRSFLSALAALPVVGRLVKPKFAQGGVILSPAKPYIVGESCRDAAECFPGLRAGRTWEMMQRMRASAEAEPGFRGLMLTSDPKGLMGLFTDRTRDFKVCFISGGFEAVHRNGSTVNVSRPQLDGHGGKQFSSLYVEDSPWVMDRLSQEALQKYSAQVRSPQGWTPRVPS